jgi:hypothetical protein
MTAQAPCMAAEAFCMTAQAPCMAAEAFCMPAQAPCMAAKAFCMTEYGHSLFSIHYSLFFAPFSPT